MESNRNGREDNVLVEEMIGEEEDYEEYARLREEREGLRRRRRYSEDAGKKSKTEEYSRGQGRAAERADHNTRQRRDGGGRKKNHSVRNIIFLILIMVIIVFAGYLIYMRSLFHKVNTVELEHIVQNSISRQVQEDSVMAGYQNIALFGVDSREQDLLSGDNRSDAIMILSINKKTGESRLVSVYRDTFLDIGGGDFRKCNAAYAFGGPQQAITMLNTNLDLNITDFVTVGFEGLAETIDALGGIDLEITEEEMEYINSYMEDMYNEINIPYEEVTDWGMQHLSGIQATAYCRIRYTEGDDFKRAERQRTVLSLTMEKARKANPLQLAAAAKGALSKTATSLGSGELLLLLLRAKTMDLTQSEGFPSEKDRMFATINGESCVVPYYLTTNVKNLHRTLFGQEEYEPSQTVEEINDIINGYVE